MRKFLVFTFVSFLVFSCSRDKSNFTVEVQVDGNHGEMLYLAQRTLTGTPVLDSTLPEKSGKYLLKGYTSQPDFFVLYNQPRNYINLIIHPGDEFRVLTKAIEFDANYLIEGSKDSRLIQKLVTMQNRTLEKITEISEVYENSKGRPDFERIRSEIDSAYQKVVDEHKQFSIDLIRNNPESLATLMTLYQQLGRNEPVFDYKRDLTYYEMVDSNLSRLYPNSEAVIDLNRKVTGLREVVRLEPGSVAPQISLPDSSGNSIALSSFRGKYVVLIFWASWSSLSVDAVNSFASLYRKQLQNEIVLFQVSLDRTRRSWTKYVEDKNAAGIHVSDLKYWDSPVADLYHIHKLPVVYLLNRQGEIVAKDFRAEDLPGLLEKQ